MPRRARIFAPTVALLLSLPLAACGSPLAAQEHVGSLEFFDGWAKASDGDMTAVFGVLRNTAGHELTVSAANCQGAERTELHQTISGSDGSKRMQAVDGGFVVAAGEQLELAPGGNHLMLMGLIAPIPAGATVSCTLTVTGGGELAIEVPAKDFAGANESYHG